MIVSERVLNLVLLAFAVGAIVGVAVSTIMAMRTLTRIGEKIEAMIEAGLAEKQE